MNDFIWICGKVTKYPAYEFQGVFDSKVKAIKACKSSSYFIAPAEINVELPDETSIWPGTEYPLAQ